MLEKLNPKEFNRELLISSLTDQEASLEERITATKQLFPMERKKEILSGADVDSKGRHVRYFRLATYDELRVVLSGNKSDTPGHSATEEIFLSKTEMIKQVLINFLQQEKIYDQLKENFEFLSAHFTLRNYQDFVQEKLPRIELFKLHIGVNGPFSGITGLTSLSVGAPYQPPYNPYKKRSGNQEGLPVIEFSIPSDEVYVHPLFKRMNIEMEKEVNTLAIKPEWVVDVYNGTEDFAERFVKDPTSVLYPEYQAMKEGGSLIMDYISDTNIWDILQHWKEQESIADLIPKIKLEDIDENNPMLQIPLRQTS